MVLREPAQEGLGSIVLVCIVRTYEVVANATTPKLYGNGGICTGVEVLELYPNLPDNIQTQQFTCEARTYLS